MKSRKLKKYVWIIKVIYFTRNQMKYTVIKLRVKSEKTELPRKAKNNYIDNYVRRIRKDNPHVIIEGTIISEYGNKRQFSISHVSLATAPYVKGATTSSGRRFWPDRSEAETEPLGFESTRTLQKKKP